MGQPVARLIPGHTVAEVTRVAVADARHGCSMLYGAAARVAQSWGFFAIMTYTLASESGASLRAAGWWPDVLPSRGDGGSWNAPGRPRNAPKGDALGDKVRWIRLLREWDEQFDAPRQRELLEAA
jgi:hypothetical protein